MNVGIIGLGLVGGSAFRALADKCSVRGWDVLPGTRDGAMAAGFEIAPPQSLAAWADVILVAVPPEETAGAVEEVLGLGARAVIDTASVKEQICGQIEDERFVGGHPLAGGSGRGWRDSRAEIIEKSTWALVSEKPAEETFLAATELLGLLSSPWAATTPDEHDRALARSSHLVQFLHVVLAAAASDWSPLARRLSGPALRDSTRLAESPFELWQSIAENNEENIAAILFAFGEEIRSAQLAVLHPDADLRTLWRHGSLGRQQILDARWQDSSWRESSLPRGEWWQGLCERSKGGALFRNPRFDTGLLLIEQS